MIMEEVRRRAIEKSPFCAGLDLTPAHIPTDIKNKHQRLEDQYVAYAKLCIDASKDLVCCYKIQIACYEALGLEGLSAYSRIVKYIDEIGELSIGDIKRGDIGSTAAQYAKGHFSGDFEVDMVTLAPYMGEDSISPFYDYFKAGKGAFVLGKTSNPSGVDLQDLLMEDGKMLYTHTLKKIRQWGNELRKEGEIAPIGAVIAVNQLKNKEELKELTKDMMLLIPGYGAQGASLDDIRSVTDNNAVINVSRGYIGGLADSTNLEADLRNRALQLAKECRTCIQ